MLLLIKYILISILEYSLICISTIIVICILIMTLIECLNRLRYQNFLLALNKKTKINYSEKNCIDTYCNFIKKHVNNDNFLNILKASFPDGLMSRERINKTVQYYLFACTDTLCTSSANINNQIIKLPSVQRTINQLCKKFAKQYLLNNDLYLQNQIYQWLDIIDISMYKNSIIIISEYVCYIKFTKIMKYNNFICYTPNSYIRYWKYQDNRQDIEHMQYNIMLISYFEINEIINKKKIDNYNMIYIEIRGISPYYSIFDMLTINKFTMYYDINDIVKHIAIIFDHISSWTKNENIKNDKVNLYANNIMTIFVPSMIVYYSEFIDNIFLIDPICYPYSYQTLYHNLYKNAFKKMSILNHDNHHEIQNSEDNNYIINYLRSNMSILYLLHQHSLLDIYINKNLSDKGQNKMYDHKTHISFSKSVLMYTNPYILSICLNMYSKVNIDSDISINQIKK